MRAGCGRDAGDGGGRQGRILRRSAAILRPRQRSRHHKAHYATWRLVAAGVWAKLDVFYVFAGGDRAHQPQVIELRGDSGQFAGFTADRGYVSDGSTSYINTNYNPATAGGNYTLDDAMCRRQIHQRHRRRARAVAGSSTIADGWAHPEVFLNVFVRANDGSTGIANANRQGRYIGSRTNSTTLEAYKNGVSIGEPGSDTSTSIPSRDIYRPGAERGRHARSAQHG